MRCSLSEAWEDGPGGKNLSAKLDEQPEFNQEDTHAGRRRELIPTDCPFSSMAHECTFTHIMINKCEK